MIESMLAKYNINNSEDYHRAVREIIQEIALAGPTEVASSKTRHSMAAPRCVYFME